MHLNPLKNSVWFCVVVFVVSFLCLELAATDESFNDHIINGRFLNDDLEWEDYDPDVHDHTKLLSRSRRYLTFPAGSSFQLVYDLIVGVVDYTNYLILGVTSALAWQLPSDAPSEIIEHLKEKLKEGTLGVSRNDSIDNIQYVNTKPKKKYSHKSSYINNDSGSQSSSYFASNQFHPPMHSKYYDSGPIYYTNKPTGNGHSRKYSADKFSIRRNPLTEWKYGKIRKVSPSSPSSSQSSKWSQWWNGSPKRRRTQYRKKKPKFERKHRVFPVFAKRVVDKHNRQKRHHIDGPSLTKIDKIHLRYHRSSRHELYEKIEKYLETHNKNGHECVLKALCETGQKGHEEEPGTFVGEIVRVIFTMPESEDPVHNHKHKMYDEANAHQGDCEKRYPLCPDSVWKADFIF